MTRDEKGRFAQGNPGGGRKPKATEEKYLELMKATVTQSDWIAIIERAVSDAKRGDTAARKFLADYIIGPPIQRTEHTGADGEALSFVITERKHDQDD